MLKDGDKIKDGSKKYYGNGYEESGVELKGEETRKWWALLVDRTENSIVPVRSRSVDRK